MAGGEGVGGVRQTVALVDDDFEAFEDAVAEEGREAMVEGGSGGVIMGRDEEEAGDEVEEEVRGRIIVCSEAESASVEDVEDPIFRLDELMAAAEAVEESEAVDAHEGVEADFVMGEIGVEDAGGVDVVEHLIHDAFAGRVVEVVEDGVGEGVAVHVRGKGLETGGDVTVVPAEEALVRVVVDE